MHFGIQKINVEVTSNSGIPKIIDLDQEACIQTPDFFEDQWKAEPKIRQRIIKS